MSTAVPQDTLPSATRTPPPAPQGGQKALRAVGLAVTGLVVVTAVLSAAPEMVRHADEVDLAWPAGTERVEVVAGVGQVVVREDAALEPGISVDKHWSFREPTVEQSTEGGVTRVSLDCPVGPLVRCHGDWSLAVPAGTDVTVRTSAGEIELAGLTGDVVASTSVGSVRLDGAPATADLRSSVGSVTAVLTEPAALLRAESSVGDVDLTLPRDVAYAVRTRSDMADATTNVAQDSASPYVVDARTDLGSIRIDDE